MKSLPGSMLSTSMKTLFRRSDWQAARVRFAAIAYEYPLHIIT
jgi:hypothetical protein